VGVWTLPERRNGNDIRLSRFFVETPMACTEVEMCVSEATRGIDHPHFPFLKVVVNEEWYMLQKKVENMNTPCAIF
jgi:hypothetical protein